MTRTALELYLYMNNSEEIINWLNSEGVTTENEKNTVIIISHDITNTLAISDMVWILGRDIDNSSNLHIPGSYIKYKFDLAEMGLAWQPNITEIKQFNELRTYIRQLFPTL